VILSPSAAVADAEPKISHPIWAAGFGAEALDSASADELLWAAELDVAFELDGASPPQLASAIEMAKNKTRCPLLRAFGITGAMFSSCLAVRCDLGRALQSGVKSGRVASGPPDYGPLSA
jgi:hypothetical protein